MASYSFVAVSSLPPNMDENLPSAIFLQPPPTHDFKPRAVLWVPLAQDNSPRAMLLKPPPTAARLPSALLNSPPLTEALLPLATFPSS